MSLGSNESVGKLVKNESIDSGRNRFEVFVSKDRFASACYAAYAKGKKSIKVPGFRVGKVPKKVAEEMYGKSLFINEAIDSISEPALSGAVKESGLDVVGVENFKVLKASEDEGFSFSVECILKPEVSVENYKGIEVKKPVRQVTEKDVADRIMALRERCGRTTIVDDGSAAKKGDIVVIDFEGFVDGISFPGGKAKNYSLKLGSSSFVGNFEDQIVGHKVKDKFDVNVKFPEDYHVQDLKGKTALFRCKLNEIKKVELPDEDDEFAKDVSEFSTLKDLKENIKKDIQKTSDDAADRALESRVLSAVVSNIKGSIPPIMFENKYNELVRNFSRELAAKGFRSLESYFNYAKIDEDAFKNDLKFRARYQVKLELALEAIVRLEKLKVNDEDLQKEYEKMAEIYKTDIDKVKNLYKDRVEILEHEILDRKAIKFLKDNAKVVEEVLNV